jgi:endonuclease/exonuclease/phosphatase family metal-dependent hydrolase
MTRKTRLKWVLLTGVLVLSAVTVLLFLSRSIENFPDPEGPLFSGNYAGEQPVSDDQITVVTWNIKFAEEVEEAIEEWDAISDLARADIVLLQEMDEAGVELMAKQLGYNYVYYPASIHDRHNRTFGNAILSKWPIVDSAKILLPHHSPTNEQRRIAVRAVIEVGEREVLAYSVHTETIVLSAKKRGEQIDALVDDIKAQPQRHVVVGGDFNTFTQSSIDDLESTMAEAGLERISAGTGATVLSLGGFGFTLDHLFAKNMTLLDSGVWPDTSASDHAPVWAVLSPYLTPYVE